MQPDRDRQIGLRCSEGGQVAVGCNTQRRGIAHQVGVIRHPVHLACEQTDIDVIVREASEPADDSFVDPESE